MGANMKMKEKRARKKKKNEVHEKNKEWCKRYKKNA
jgi:hypothetical protein